MNKSLQRIKAWRSRRQLRSLKQWEQLREKGKTRFVVQSALTYGVVIVGASSLVENLFEGPRPISLFKIIFFGLFGIGMGLSGWSDMESKYKKALNETLKAPPTGKTLPDAQSSGEGASKA